MLSCRCDCATLPSLIWHRHRRGSVLWATRQLLQCPQQHAYQHVEHPRILEENLLVMVSPVWHTCQSSNLPHWMWPTLGTEPQPQFDKWPETALRARGRLVSFLRKAFDSLLFFQATRRLPVVARPHLQTSSRCSGNRGCLFHVAILLPLVFEEQVNSTHPISNRAEGLTTFLLEPTTASNDEWFLSKHLISVRRGNVQWSVGSFAILLIIAHHRMSDRMSEAMSERMSKYVRWNANVRKNARRYVKKNVRQNSTQKS